MFLGKADEAVAIYVEHKGEEMAGMGKWEDVAGQDLAELQKHGLEVPHLTRVKEAMAAAPVSPKVFLLQAAKYQKANKHAEAITPLKQYVDAVKARRGENDPQYADALKLLAFSLNDVKRLAEAESLMRRALAIDEGT